MSRTAPHRRTVPDGTVLARQGQLGDRAYLVLSGSLQVRCDGVLVARLRPGDVAGEQAVLRGIPRTADLVADGEVEVAEYNGVALRDAIDHSPVIGELVEHALEARPPASSDR